MWLRAIGWELRKAEGEGARKMLERGLQSLPRRKHIKVLLAAPLNNRTCSYYAAY